MFDIIITLVVVLCKLMLHAFADKRFLLTMRDIRLGRCSDDNKQDMIRLKHELNPENKTLVTHFFKKSPVVIHNRAAVENLLGKLET